MAAAGVGRRRERPPKGVPVTTLYWVVVWMIVDVVVDVLVTTVEVEVVNVVVLILDKGQW